MNLFIIFFSTILFDYTGYNPDLRIEKVLTIAQNEFVLKDSAHIKVSPWEDSLFATKNIRWFSFKSRIPLPDNKNTFFRFILYVYTFNDSFNAQKRLLNIDIEPPRLRSEYYKMFTKGFRINSTVFIFKTDSFVFKNKMEETVKFFCKELPAICD